MSVDRAFQTAALDSPSWAAVAIDEARQLAPHATQAMHRVSRASAGLLERAEADLSAGLDASEPAGIGPVLAELRSNRVAADEARKTAARYHARVLEARSSLARIRGLAEAQLAECEEAL